MVMPRTYLTGFDLHNRLRYKHTLFLHTSLPENSSVVWSSFEHYLSTAQLLVWIEELTKLCMHSGALLKLDDTAPTSQLQSGSQPHLLHSNAHTPALWRAFQSRSIGLDCSFSWGLRMKSTFFGCKVMFCLPVTRIYLFPRYVWPKNLYVCFFLTFWS